MEKRVRTQLVLPVCLKRSTGLCLLTSSAQCGVVWLFTDFPQAHTVSWFYSVRPSFLKPFSLHILERAGYLWFS